jgi:ribosome-associated protein
MPRPSYHRNKGPAAHLQPRDDLPPSKSQKKRDMLALQKIGTQLVELSRDQLARMPMSDTLSDAVRHAQDISSHEGRRRQLQYIGRVMRSEDVEPLRAALAALEGTSRAQTVALHALERWRERLIDDDDALDELIERYPAAREAQRIVELRTTIRQARRERDTQRPPKHYRELFQQLKDIVEAP